MRIIVTAGGTREYIDPVRYISNASTGKMGYAIAEQALKAGHNVLLITAPTSLTPPADAQVINIVSAADMAKAVQENFDDCDCLIMAAAVSDYTPANTSYTKIKKASSTLSLTLKPTLDILAWAGENKSSQILIGFALEDKDLLKNAEEKMARKNLDAIVANSTEAISADESKVHIKTEGSKWQDYPVVSKESTAKKILELAVSIAENR